MQIDERAIVAKVLAGYTDPNYEERPGFFPFKAEADRIVSALEKARAADANQSVLAWSEAGYKAACVEMERQKAAIPGMLAVNVCISSLCVAYKDGAQADDAALKNGDVHATGNQSSVDYEEKACLATTPGDGNLNQQAYKSACEARTHYRQYTDVLKYTIADEDSAFIAAYNGLGGGIPVIDKALATAAEILANFKGDPCTKLEEWQACYAKLFTQMTEFVASVRRDERGTPVGYTLIPSKALEWLFGEADGDSMPPPDAKGKYWWRSVFRKKINSAEDGSANG